jgi:hypothetical protein
MPSLEDLSLISQLKDSGKGMPPTTRDKSLVMIEVPSLADSFGVGRNSTLVDAESTCEVGCEECRGNEVGGCVACASGYVKLGSCGICAR